MCDFGTANCTHYQEFGINQIWVIFSINIALIRVNRPIQFGPMMKPICLPFGRNNIPEPPIGTVLTGLGQRSWPTFVKCVRNFTINTELEKKLFKTTNPCYPVGGGPVMHQFAPQRMVLEGIVHIFSYDLTLSSGKWLERTMRM